MYGNKAKIQSEFKSVDIRHKNSKACKSKTPKECQLKPLSILNAMKPENNYKPAYDNRFPMKYPGEFLVEKSVGYVMTNQTEIEGKAAAMKNMNPNLKIFAFMTDPVSRLYSHLNMCIREKLFFCKNQNLDEVMKKVTNYFQRYNSTEFVASEKMKYGAYYRIGRAYKIMVKPYDMVHILWSLL